jgi:hypothetical protein
MPILNLPLDQNGHALIEILLLPAAPRRQALQAAGQAVPTPRQLAGMIDTGAAVSVIDTQVRQALRLAPYRIRRAVVPNTPAPVRVPSYKVDLAMVHPAGGFVLLCPAMSVLEMPLRHTGVEVLVGCDVLAYCQFVHNGLAKSFSLAY